MIFHTLIYRCMFNEMKKATFLLSLILFVFCHPIDYLKNLYLVMLF